jgi:hypothetical protein
MSNQTAYKEPRIDKASTKIIVETIAGNDNREVVEGDFIEQKSNIFCGAMYRTLGLLNTLENMGMRFGKERNALLNPTIGFCTELPRRGMRGEIIEVITGQELPKTEKVRDTDSGAIVRVVTEQPLEANNNRRR